MEGKKTFNNCANPFKKQHSNVPVSNLRLVSRSVREKFAPLFQFEKEDLICDSCRLTPISKIETEITEVEAENDRLSKIKQIADVLSIDKSLTEEAIMANIIESVKSLCSKKPSESDTLEHNTEDCPVLAKTIVSLSRKFDFFVCFWLRSMLVSFF